MLRAHANETGCGMPLTLAPWRGKVRRKPVCRSPGGASSRRLADAHDQQPPWRLTPRPPWSGRSASYGFPWRADFVAVLGVTTALAGLTFRRAGLTFRRKVTGSKRLRLVLT